MDCKLDLKSILFICFVVLALQHFFNIFGVEGYSGSGSCRDPSKPCGYPPRCRAKTNFTITNPRTRERIRGRACSRQQLLREHAKAKRRRRIASYRRHRR